MYGRMAGVHVCTYIGYIGEDGKSKVKHLGFRIFVLTLCFWILRICNKSNALDMLPLMSVVDSVSVTENSPTWLCAIKRVPISLRVGSRTLGIEGPLETSYH